VGLLVEDVDGGAEEVAVGGGVLLALQVRDVDGAVDARRHHRVEMVEVGALLGRHLGDRAPGQAAGAGASKDDVIDAVAAEAAVIPRYVDVATGGVDRGGGQPVAGALVADGVGLV
jgi:hypothetical protein